MGRGLSFWCEGGEEFGYGHVSRCLTLAIEARNRGLEDIFFVTGASDSKAKKNISAEGFSIRDQSSSQGLQCDVAVVDMARSDVMSDKTLLASQVTRIREFSENLVWIDSMDDDAISLHPALKFDIVVTPYLGAENSTRPSCRKWLSGADFAVLPSKFVHVPASRREGSRKRLLVTMGGSDLGKLTELILGATAGFPALDRRAIIGPFFSRQRLLDIGERFPDCEIVEGRGDLYGDLSESDVVVTTVGLTRYEAVASERPTLIVSQSSKYSAYLTRFEDAGLAKIRNLENQIGADQIAEDVRGLLTVKLEKNFPRIVDGLGAARVLDAIVSS